MEMLLYKERNPTLKQLQTIAAGSIQYNEYYEDENHKVITEIKTKEQVIQVPPWWLADYYSPADDVGGSAFLTLMPPGIEQITVKLVQLI